jgi:DNA polymerase-3 subunit gamma/tau
MSYVVLARKYRPAQFDEVVGQEPIARTLKNAISAGRVAHAYLFTGPRGVGKTSMARILAMGLNCSSVDAATTNPCGRCASCNGIFIGEDVDVREIDGASNNGVDDVRTLRDNAIYRPAHSRHKIYVIDEVHMLSKEAFNALLKTLEEPPEHVKFIFATTEPHKLPETIHSRCQRFDFKNISSSDIARRLRQICTAEKVKATDEVLLTIARRARGGMRDSQSLLDQLMAYDPEELTGESIDFVLGRTFEGEIDRLLEAFRSRNAGEALRVVNELTAEGHDMTEFLGQLLETVRTLMVIKACGNDGKLLDLPHERVSKLSTVGEGFAMDNILYMLQVLSEADRKVRTSVEKRIVLETAAVKLASMEDFRPLIEIVEMLKGLGSNASLSGAGAEAAPAPQKTGAAKSAVGRRAARPQAEAQDEVREEPLPQRLAESESEAPAVAASGLLGEVQRAWPRLLEAIKSEHQPSLAAVLRDARAVALDGDQVTLQFPAGFGYHVERLAEQEKVNFVEKCLARIVGKTIKIGISHEGDKARSQDGAAKSAGAKASGQESERTRSDESPGVKTAKHLFGGEVMGEKK